MKSRSLFSSIFSSVFSPTIAGLDIADQSVKYVVLNPTDGGFELADYGMLQIPEGVIVDGNIEDPKRLSVILAALRKQKGIKHARVSLPESHAFILENAGITPHAHEMRAEALSRVLLPNSFDAKHRGASMLVNLGETQTDVSVIHNNKVYLAKSFSLPENPTRTLADAFGLPENEARSLKRTVGLSRKPEHEQVFAALQPDMSAIAKKLNDSFIEWHTHETEKRPAIQEIILAGSNAHIAGLPEYLSSALRTKVILGNPWMNLNSLETYIPPMHAEEALAYAAAFGLAKGE